MRYSCKDAVEYDLKMHYELKEKYEEECKLRSSCEGSQISLNRERKCKKFYSVKKPNETRFRYVGDDSHPEIQEIREQQFFSKTLEVINDNINAMESFLRVYHHTGASTINELLQPNYQLTRNDALLLAEPAVEKWLSENLAIKRKSPPHAPEGLTVKAFDGTPMRSRAECIHYEAFFIYDVPAIFELPYKIGSDTLHPDFTALDVFEMRPVLFEHLGNWFHSNPSKRSRYRADSVTRWDQYAEIGFSPESNLFLTFGIDETHFDAQAIHRKVAMLASPPPSMETIEMLSRL